MSTITFTGKPIHMTHIFRIGTLLMCCIGLSSCQSQNKHYNNDQLSDDFDSSMPFYYHIPEVLKSTDTSPVFNDIGQKIVLTGTVYKTDGKTPAPGVILYYYQTDSNGIYATDTTEKRNMPKNKLGQTHGYIRGWIQSDKNGHYSIFTLKPEAYPGRNEPAHIHITVKDHHMNDPYYIDDFVFDDDVLLTTEKRRKMENRGGSGVIRFIKKEGIWVGERPIILGLNVPDYPIDTTNVINSGRRIGEDIISFTPSHAYGPDKGTTTCPICKYGWYHGILYFVGNHPNWNDIKKWLLFLESESEKRGKYLKVYFVYGNEHNYDKTKRTQELVDLGTELDLHQLALTFVPSFADASSDIYLNDINPEVENTFIIYKRSTIVDQFVNLEPSSENFKKISDRLDETVNEYFKYARPHQN